MPELVLSLLGAPRVERDGAPVVVDTRKAIALLVYLAVTRQPHRRDALAALLWPEYDQEHARAALRRTLSALNKALGDPYLCVERETIGIASGATFHDDVSAFRQQLARCAAHAHAAHAVCRACLEPLTAAVTLYRDDFLAGFSLRDSPPFDEWQFAQRDALRGELAGALERLVRGHIAQGQYDAAPSYRLLLSG